MVVIRLSRGGAKKAPFYHIVAADRREPRDGRFIERLGHFNPKARGKESRLELNKERIEHWISKGAQPSERVSHLLKAFVKDAAAATKGAPTVAETKKAQQKASATDAKKKMEATPKKEPSSEPAPKEAAPSEATPKTEAKAEEKPTKEPKPEENK